MASTIEILRTKGALDLWSLLPATAGVLRTKGEAAEPSEARAPGGTCGVKIIMDLRTVSGFKGAYRLQFYDYLSTAYVVCFGGCFALTLRFKLSGKARH